MEEKNNSKMTLIIILLIVIILAMAFLIYKNYFRNKQNDAIIEELNSKIGNLELKEIDEVKKDDENDVINNENIATTTEERFQSFMENYKNNLDKYNQKNDGRMVLTTIDIDNFWVELKNGIVYFKMSKNCSLYSKYGEEYEVAKDIAKIYMCEIGNGGCSDLVMLGYDGSIKSIFMLSRELENGINIKNYDYIKNAVNVVNIFNDEFAEYVVFDIDGNMYEIN